MPESLHMCRIVGSKGEKAIEPMEEREDEIGRTCSKRRRIDICPYWESSDGSIVGNAPETP